MSEIQTSVDFRHSMTVPFTKSSVSRSMFGQKVSVIQTFAWIMDTFCVRKLNTQKIGFQTFIVLLLRFQLHCLALQFEVIWNNKKLVGCLICTGQL